MKPCEKTSSTSSRSGKVLDVNVVLSVKDDMILNESLEIIRCLPFRSGTEATIEDSAADGVL